MQELKSLYGEEDMGFFLIMHQSYGKEWCLHSYKQRWIFFLQILHSSLEHDIPFNQTVYTQEIENLEDLWTMQLNSSSFATHPSGNIIELSRNLYQKWSPFSCQPTLQTLWK